MRELIIELLRFLGPRESHRDEIRALDAQRADALQRQLDRALNQYTTVNTIIWTVFSIFAAGHAVLVDALVQSPSQHGYISAGYGLVLSAVGFLAAVAWVLLMRRVVGHLQWHEDLIKRLEAREELGIDERDRILPAGVAGSSSEFADIKPLPVWRYTKPNPSHARKLGYGPPAKRVMQWCTRLTTTFWFIALCRFAYRQFLGS